LFFNFVLEYNIIKVQTNPKCLKLNGKHQILVYGDEVNIFYGSIHSIKGNTEALLLASKETGLVVNAAKTSTLSCLDTNIADEVIT